MEYLQVFNDKKEAIDEKVLREDKYNLPEGKRFMVVVIFIENNEGKFLMQKTSKSRNSIIATTGGHVIYGDIGFNTILRETKEELGLDLESNEVEYVDTLKYNDGFLETYYVKKVIDIRFRCKYTNKSENNKEKKN